ncbi:MAG TPA: hypothetical protein VEU96_32815 [Bryobacteraceae bacterium]|nr:hypothetical protein [Bryobacteraceae bacterium]
MPKFDLEKTQALAGLFAQPRESRDDKWRRDFYAAVPDASLRSFEPQINLGPDQFPYFHLAIPDPGPLTPFSISHLLDFVLDNGLGIAIFGDSTRSGGPQWVFSYGDLLAFSLYGSFDGDPSVLAQAPKPSGGSHSVLVAAPSESYLPVRARRALGAYARKIIQINHPKIGLVDDPQSTPSRSLMINLTLADYHGDQRKLSAALGYLSWFVPRSYRIAAMPPGWTDSNFVPLP